MKKTVFSFLRVQENFPLRFQGFHFINEPLYLYTVYSIIKPFLKEKIRCRVSFIFYLSLLIYSLFFTGVFFFKVHFHGNNFNSLHKHLNPNILPKYFGGTLDFDSITWVQQFLKKDQFFEGNLIRCK